MSLKAEIGALRLGFGPKAAEFPTILRNVGIWVRKLRILSFLTNFTMGN